MVAQYILYWGITVQRNYSPPCLLCEMNPKEVSSRFLVKNVLVISLTETTEVTFFNDASRQTIIEYFVVVFPKKRMLTSVELTLIYTSYQVMLTLQACKIYYFTPKPTLSASGGNRKTSGRVRKLCKRVHLKTTLLGNNQAPRFGQVEVVKRVPTELSDLR